MRELSPGSEHGDHDEQRRLRRLAMVITLGLGLVAARIWYLQVIRGDSFQRLAERNHLRVVPITAPRGNIYDRQGRLLVTNRLSFTISVVPDAYRRVDPAPAVAALAQVLQVPQPEVARAWEGGGQRFPFEPVRVLRDVAPRAVLAVEERRFELPGVVVEEEPVREYPLGPTAAHVLGRVAPVTLDELQRLGSMGYRGTDLIGRTGLERQYEHFLRGGDGYEQVEVDALNRVVQVLDTQPPQSGYNLQLTLDLDLQRHVEQAMVEGLERVAAGVAIPAGAALVLDVATGGVLAMASFPAYDPGALMPWSRDRERYYQLLSSSPGQPFLNRATQGLYAPGSIFKPITAVAALEERRVRPDEMYYADGYGPYGKLDWQLRARPPLPPAGWVDMAGGFEQSSNDYFWELGQRVGIEDLARWARNFGLGAPVGLDLFPPDQEGLVPDPFWKQRRYAGGLPWQQRWYEAETLDVAIGQGALMVTPLQMGVVYLALANQGVVMRPHLVQAVLDGQGQAIYRAAPQVLRVVPARPATWEAVRRGLVRVISGPKGTARRAFQGFPVPVAGKTGTAQLAPSDQETHAWFAGFAPADRPQVVVIVLVERGGGGAGVAAPIARRILEAYFAGAGSATASAARGEGAIRVSQKLEGRQGSR